MCRVTPALGVVVIPACSLVVAVTSRPSKHTLLSFHLPSFLAFFLSSLSLLSSYPRSDFPLAVGRQTWSPGHTDACADDVMYDDMIAPVDRELIPRATERRLPCGGLLVLLFPREVPPQG